MAHGVSATSSGIAGASVRLSSGDLPVEALLPGEAELCGLLRAKRVCLVRDLVYLPAWELRDWLLVPQEEAEAVVRHSWAACAAPSASAWDLAARAVPSLASPLPSLDAALGGGLAGTFLELAGAPGTGKTQFCLHAAALTAARGGEVFWIDTERSFAPARLLELLEGLCGAAVAAEVVPDDGQATMLALARVRRRVCSSLHELTVIVSELSQRLACQEALPSLIVVDSIAAVARGEGDPMGNRRDVIPRRQAALNALASLFKALVAAPVTSRGTPQPAIVVTNQVAGDPVNGGCKVTLGNVWHHAVNWRLVLSCSPPGDHRAAAVAAAAGPGQMQRFLHLEKSPCSPPVVLSFVIGPGGLRGHEAG